MKHDDDNFKADLAVVAKMRGLPGIDYSAIAVWLAAAFFMAMLLAACMGRLS